MKIFFFIHSLTAGGAERVTANLANYWCNEGWETSIVTFSPATEDFFALHPRIRRISLNLREPSQSVGMAIWQNIRRIKKLRGILIQERPDLVLSLMTTANALLGLASIGIRDLVCIGSERTYPPQIPMGNAWVLLRRFSYVFLAAVTALTKESALWLRSQTWAKNVTVIPNSIPWPLPCHEPLKYPHSFFGAQRRVILAGGRHSHEKGFDLLISAFARFANSHNNWDLAILGDGPLLGRHKELVQSAGLAGRVVFPGPVGNMGDWFKRADFFVMSSLYEGFPNILAEALASGCPAVSFDCDTGPRDIIRHDVDGLLVPAGSISDLAMAMERMVVDEDLRQRFACRAIEARDRFSVAKVTQMWEHLFDELLAKT